MKIEIFVHNLRVDKHGGFFMRKSAEEKAKKIIEDAQKNAKAKDKFRCKEEISFHWYR